jgi:homoserine O-acetyltransferase/O-succinyltransferase
MKIKHLIRGLILTALVLSLYAFSRSQELPKAAEGDYVAHDFHFRSGETLPELRLHYHSAGQPIRDANGHVINAVMLVHATSGEGGWFLRNKAFADELLAPGQLLDANRYYIIAPDTIGHGKSSKPSDGLHARFPHYDYDDMVEAEHLLLTEGLNVDHLRLFMGMSMGCMHAFMFAEKYPDFLDAAMPLACSTVEIGGRNRIFRKVLMDAIRNDPGYQNGEYKQQPAALRTLLGLILVEITSPIRMQRQYPTREMADAALKEFVDSRIRDSDANDVLYAWDASRNYDPSGKLDQIKASVMWVNSANDAVNPPELGIAEEQIKKVKRWHFALLPIGDLTRGHSTHSYPTAWKQYLAEQLKQVEESHIQWYAPRLSVAKFSKDKP